MRLAFLFVLALGFSSKTVSLSAKEPLVLDPSSGWTVDYAEDKCRLLRSFGEGQDQVAFHFEQSGPEPFYTLALFGAPARRRNIDVMRVQFGPFEEASERSFISGKHGKNKTHFVVMHGIHLAAASDGIKEGEFVVVQIDPEREEKIHQLTLSGGLRTPLELNLGPMRMPLAALRTCVADLMDHLGPKDEPGAKSAVPMNQKKMARFISEHYPERMLRNEQEGTVNVRLTINPQGKVSACQVAESNRPATFDDVVCFGLMKIGDFEPAKDAEGKARFGFYSMKVTYRLN